MIPIIIVFIVQDNTLTNEIVWHQGEIKTKLKKFNYKVKMHKNVPLYIL